MSIHPTAIVEDGAQIGDGATIGAYCHIGPRVVLSDQVALAPHVVVEGRTLIGARTKVQSFTVLGGAPQHLGYKGEDTALEIGEDCLIREHVTMNLGTVAGGGVTKVGNHCMFMTGAHIAHDCAVGDQSIFANNATLGGHVIVGEGVFFGGLAAVHQHARIGDFAFIGGCAGVPNDVIPFGSAIGNHAMLAGLNIIGMKRRGLDRDVIHQLRNAYKQLFSGTDPFAERLSKVEQDYAQSPDVLRITKFIRAGESRPLMQPRD